jgi:hypothetical protein
VNDWLNKGYYLSGSIPTHDRLQVVTASSVFASKARLDDRGLNEPRVGI